MQEQANNLQNPAANQGSIVGVDDSKPQKREAKETAIISVCAGQGVEDAFLELHCDYVVSGGQTMNPSTEDMVAAVKEVNAKNVIILPNNSNIVMTAQQTATILEGEVNVIVIKAYKRLLLYITKDILKVIVQLFDCVHITWVEWHRNHRFDC